VGTLAVISQILLALAGIFLMIVVLLQRGRGGGLAGAFGGLGGQSAFGTKAGDVFTRITIIIAIIWVALAGGSGYFLRASSEERGESSFQGNVNDEEEDGAGALPGDEEPGVLEAPELPEADAAPDTDESAAPTGAGETPDNPTDGSAGTPEAAPAADSPTEE
jgi:preprotein translocase subunit SecG